MLTILRVRRLDRPSRKGGRGELASGLEVAGVGSSSRASSLLSGDAAGETVPSSERDGDVPLSSSLRRARGRRTLTSQVGGEGAQAGAAAGGAG